MTEPYRVGSHYGVHVYQGDRPVATFFDPEEATRFVEAVNIACALRAAAWDEGARAATMDYGIGEATNPYRDSKVVS